MVNMSEILNPDDIDIYRDLAAESLPPTFSRLREFIGGQTLVIKLAGASPPRSSRSKARFPASSLRSVKIPSARIQYPVSPGGILPRAWS